MPKNETRHNVTPAALTLKGLAAPHLPPPLGCPVVPCARCTVVKQVGTCSIQVHGVERQWEEELQVEGVG